MTFNHPGPMPSEQWPAPGAQMPTPQQPAFHFAPTAVFAKLIVGVAITYTAFTVIGAYTAPEASRVRVDAAERGVASGDAPLTVYDLVSLPSIPLLLTALVFTAIWLTNLRTNVDVLAPEVLHARSKVWATLGWFVPFVSLWFPLQFVRDVRHASQPDPVQRRIGASVGPLLGFWWFTWLVLAALGRAVSSAAIGTEPDVAMAGALDTLELVNAVVTTVACVLWVRIVQQIERNQAAQIASRA